MDNNNKSALPRSTAALASTKASLARSSWASRGSDSDVTTRDSRCARHT